MNQELSNRIQNAYMNGDAGEIEQVLSEVADKSVQTQKKTTVTPLVINTVLNNDSSASIKVYDFLKEIFGDDWYDLEFETIERLLWGKYGVALEETNRDKIWGLKYLCNSQRPFLDWWLFNQMAVAVSGTIADFEIIRSPTPGMIINAVNTMKYIRPDEPFSREVKKYISILLISEGIYVPPPSLINIVQDEFEPLISQLNKDEWQQIYNRYKEVLESKKFELEENHIDIQVRRLINAEEAALEYSK